MTSPSLAYQDAMNGIAILYDELAYAENELDKLKNPWIKCSERMPELDDEWSLAMEITHWMPLPQPPKEKV